MYRKKPQANLRYVERTALAPGKIFPADLKSSAGFFYRRVRRPTWFTSCHPPDTPFCCLDFKGTNDTRRKYDLSGKYATSKRQLVDYGKQIAAQATQLLEEYENKIKTRVITATTSGVVTALTAALQVSLWTMKKIDQSDKFLQEKILN